MTRYACAPPGAYVNFQELPIGHWVGVRLPDGRHVVADRGEPVVPAMRKVNAALVAGEPPDPAWYAEIATWLDGFTAGQLALWEAA